MPITDRHFGHLQAFLPWLLSRIAIRQYEHWLGAPYFDVSASDWCFAYREVHKPHPIERITVKAAC